MVYSRFVFRFPRIPSQVKSLLRLAGELVPLVPAKDDSKLQILMKSVAAADLIQENLSMGKESALDKLAKRYNLVSTTNEQFVSLFFETDLKDQFELNEYALADSGECVIDAFSEKYGRLLFTKYQGNPRAQERFFHSKNFDFPEVLDRVWDLYEGRLHVSVTYSSYMGNQSMSTFSSFGAIQNPLYGPMSARMDRLIARHRRWLMDGIARTYMFYGRPGTGKTSFALAFADKLAGRLLKIDAKSFSYMRVKDLTFICKALRPEFLLIDEIDKAEIMTTLPTILDILQVFKVDHVSTSIILTANVIDEFDDGFLRPGRVDTWVEFSPPDVSERAEILDKYLKSQEGVHVPEALFNMIVDKTDGLTQDYLREISLMLKYETPDEVLEAIDTWKKMLERVPEEALPDSVTNPCVKMTEEWKLGV